MILSNRRVVITGLGAVTPIGIGIKDYWSSLGKGISGISPISYFDCSEFYSKVAGEIKSFDPYQFISPKLAKRTDRSTHLAIAATQLALNDANIVFNKHFQENTPVIIGTAMSGQAAYGKQIRLYLNRGSEKVSPFAAVSCFPDACSGQISIFFKLKGPTQTICAGCAASVNAIIEGFKFIKFHNADVAIVGGTDAPLVEEIFCGFCQANVLSKKADLTPAPFDKQRDGTVISEGAGVMILESLESARNRNARIYAEVIGYSSTTDAYQMAGADPSGIERIRAIRMALESAEINAADVDLINAHGTATIQNDLNETNVIKEVFQSHAKKLFIQATKSMIGHTQGASGVLETIATIMALDQQIIHPTINYVTSDAECDLNYVPNVAIKKKIKIAVKNSFAFGGKNSILVLKAWE